MKARICTAACAAMALGITAGAFAQDPQSAASSSQTSSTQSSAKAITVTGCVSRAGQSPTGTSGTTGAEAKAPEVKFLLTSASIGGKDTTGTTGATAPPATAVASEYRLDAADAKLTPHLGHKVEITGTVAQPSSTEQTPPSASAANAPTLKVDSVKMLASSCS